MAQAHPVPVARLFPPKPPGLTIGKEINRGAWGTVYEGNLNGQPVAVKKIHNALLEGAEIEGTTESVLEGFHRECVLLEKADHRNVVKFYGAYYDQATGEPILVMERMKENLRDYLKRKRGKISLQEAIEICLSIARALRYLHCLPQPIVHRDLNDENIMISEDGTVKIGDLGQSRLKEHNAVYFYSLGPGAITFMPPESLKEGARYNEKIDTFSAGVLMLEVATQLPPVVKPINIGAVKEVVRRKADLSRLPEDHPLKPIVVHCLEDDPKKRKSTTWLYEHLHRLLMLYEYYSKVTDNAESGEELPLDKITWIHLALFQEMCKPLPALDRSDEVQATILTSCAEGDLEALRGVALESSQIISLVMNEYGWTAVHFAAYNGHLNVLQELLDTYHCDPDVKGKYKWTPVIVAARGGQVDIVKYLITEKQCFASALTEDGENILTAAARSGNAMLINWIMDVCQIEPVVNKFGESLLFSIAISGSIDIFDRMAEKFGFDPDKWDSKTLRRPITCAADYGHFSMVKHLFVKYNCDLRVKNKDGETLLHRAAYGGSIELIAWLVQEHGFDVHECNKNGHNALHLAALGGHLDIVKYLITKFADRRFESDNNGNTCLHCAAYEGHLAVGKYLIEECGFDPGTGSKNGWTALHHASRCGHLLIVRELIEKMNVDVYATNLDDQNALHRAALNGHLDIVKYLIPKFADRRFESTNFGDTCLHLAAREGHLVVVKYLIEECGFDPGTGNKGGLNALNLAALNGHLDVVKYLIPKFADRRFESDNYGNTCLHCAAQDGHLAVVKYLIEECGFDPGTGNKDGQNALHRAAFNGHLDIVKYLISKFADRRFESTNFGNTCLHLAVRKGLLVVVKYLIEECGFDPGTVNENGWTALHYASRCGHLLIVRELIEKMNVDVFATKLGGWHALHLAALGGHLDIVKYLIPKFADRRFQSDNNGYTCLHCATQKGHLAVVKYLIEECGFDPGTENKGGKTALMIAMDKGHFDIIEYLTYQTRDDSGGVSQGGSGDSQPPPTTAAGLQGHELLLLGKCWIPFGIQTLQISKNGGVFSLEPASDDVTESNTNIFQMEIPKDAIKQERLVVKYAIIFAGPLLLPEGYKFASPVVYIYLDYTALSKPVKLHVPHWIARVDSLCTDDVPLFISPHVMPENDNMYVFTAVDAAEVEVNIGFSTVRLSGHNSLLGQAMRICYKKQSRYYASLWERTGDSEHTFRVAVVYGVPAWIKVLRKYLPRTHWKMSKTVVPQIFKFVADRITGCLQEASGCGWQATLTPPVVLQNSIEFKEYSSRENMKEAIKEDLYPPSLYAIVVQHFAAERYTVTKHMRMNISGTDLDPLLVPMRVMEVEDQGQIDLLTSSLTTSPSSQTSTSEPQDFASKAFMDKYKNEFLASVAAKAIAMKLRMQDILPITVYHCVEHTDSESAKNLLFLHFEEEGTVLTILSLCDIMISVTGYPKMNALGRDMKADLTSCRFSVK